MLYTRAYSYGNGDLGMDPQSPLSLREVLVSSARGNAGCTCGGYEIVIAARFPRYPRVGKEVTVSDRQIIDPTLMAAILGYCTAHNLPAWVIHTPPESTIGGFSARLVNIIGDTASIEWANGDRVTVPVSQLSMRG